MKRISFGAVVVAGLFAGAGAGGVANAVELSPDGTGQVLIYPYYTVNANQQTIISVVNATNVAKAVKVRFLEGYNSREVLDFNLFLSEFDVWTATVFALADAGLPGDGTAMTTTDRSCTVPGRDVWTGSLGTGRPYQELLPSAYTGTRQDSGPVDKVRLREGHVEMVQMADLANPGSLRTAVTHTVAGVPANCNIVQTIDPANPQLLAPTGGLFGAGGIVNVAQGTFYAYNADAIGGFSAISLYSGNAGTPTLAQANTAPGVATALVFDAAGELFRSDYPTGQSGQGIDAVSAVFMASTVLNDYNVDDAVGSNTDWVVTFPTKRYYVDHEILGLPLGSSGAIPPFNFTFGERRSASNGDGQSCSQVDILPFDREEGRPVGPGNFPGAPPVVIPVLCTSVNVISFLPRNAPATERGVLGSALAMRTPPFSRAGWMRLNLDPTGQPHALRASSDGDIYRGLPATGFQAVNYVNQNLQPGVLANYSAAFRHRAMRTCVNTPAGTCS